MLLALVQATIKVSRFVENVTVGPYGVMMGSPFAVSTFVGALQVDEPVSSVELIVSFPSVQVMNGRPTLLVIAGR